MMRFVDCSLVLILLDKNDEADRDKINSVNLGELVACIRWSAVGSEAGCARKSAQFGFSVLITSLLVLVVCSLKCCTNMYCPFSKRQSQSRLKCLASIQGTWGQTHQKKTVVPVS